MRSPLRAVIPSLLFLATLVTPRGLVAQRVEEPTSEADGSDAAVQPVPVPTEEPTPVEPEETPSPPEQTDMPDSVAWSDIEDDWQDDSSEEKDDSEPGWFVEKLIYPDLEVAYGLWRSNAVVVTASPAHFVVQPEFMTFTPTIRFLGLGAITLERDLIASDGSTSTERETAFHMNVFELGLRIYLFESPVYVSTGFGFGASFYDKVVPVVDARLGLGFQYRGWGLEVGARTIRQPTARTVVRGDDFVSTETGFLGYVSLETNFYPDAM